MIAPDLEHFDELPSTNDKALELARQGAVTGTAVTAARQIAGRGRHGRTWTTLDGSLALSVLHRPSRHVEELASLTPCVAVGVARALAELGVEAAIKWPNDLLLAGRKVAGILCELHDTDGHPVVIVGIGLNVDVDAFPEELEQIATSLARHGATAAPNDVIHSVLREVRRMLVHHDRGGDIPAEFLDGLAGLGEAVSLSSGGDVVEGILSDVRLRDGALGITTPDGQVWVSSGELSLSSLPSHQYNEHKDLV